jgi:hypothetical protein
MLGEGGSGCVLWFGSLVDIREFSEGGQDLYIRMAISELGTISLLFFLFGLFLIFFFFYFKLAYNSCMFFIII